jgi:hypothetical protein
MERVTTNLVRLLVMTGVGAMLTSTGCATTEGDSAGAISPARAAQLAEDDCSGIPAKEREQGILAYREAMSAAQPLKESQLVGKTKIFHTRGVVFAVRAEPGMTAPWLERVAACHIDLSTSGQLASNAGATDPLLVPGTTVRVEEAAMGYVVSVRVPNDDAASEVTRRAQAFLTGPTGPAMAQGASP